MSEPGQVIELLERANQGERGAMSQLLRIVNPELRSIAGKLMARERPGHILQPTALVNELYLRLFQGQELKIEESRGFYRLAAHVMRNILTDQARGKKGQAVKVQLEENHAVEHPDAENRALLCMALRRLSKQDNKAAHVADLHYFAGLELDEIARLLSVDRRTVERRLKFARLWFKRELASSTTHVIRPAGKS